MQENVFKCSQSIARKKNSNDADSFDEWQPSLSKLKTSQVLVALNRLLKVLKTAVSIITISIRSIL